VRTRIVAERELQAFRPLRERKQPPYQGTFVWGRDIPPARPRTSPSDSNPSAAVDANRKAINEDDKERYRREERCFHCGVQGLMPSENRF
jgi:hypothetical protein